MKRAKLARVRKRNKPKHRLRVRLPLASKQVLVVGAGKHLLHNNSNRNGAVNSNNRAIADGETSKVKADQAAWEKRPVTVADLNEELSKKLRSNHSKNLRLINFWSTTCGPCVKEFPDLIDTGRRFQNRPFEFISISLDPVAHRAAVSKFLESRHAAVPDPTVKSLKGDGLTTNNFHWTGGNPDLLAQAIEPEWTGALPHTVLVAPGGKILWSHSGELDVVEVRRQILKGLE